MTKKEKKTETPKKKEKAFLYTLTDKDGKVIKQTDFLIELTKIRKASDIITVNINE